MAAFTTIAAGISAAAGVGSALSQRRQARATSRAYAAQQRQADIANARERRAAVRNARVARASIESQAATTGVLGSSSVSAATSNVTTATNENISFLDQNIALMAQASRANQQAARASGQASMFQTIGALSERLAGRVPRTKAGKS